MNPKRPHKNQRNKYNRIIGSFAPDDIEVALPKKKIKVDDAREFTRSEVEKELILYKGGHVFGFKKFEIYRAFVAFEQDTNTFKTRPIVVVKDKGDTVLCLRCTSKHKTYNPYIQYPVRDMESAGLNGSKNGESYIDLSSTIEIKKFYIYKRLGKLSSEDIEQLQDIGI